MEQITPKEKAEKLLNSVQELVPLNIVASDSEEIVLAKKDAHKNICKAIILFNLAESLGWITGLTAMSNINDTIEELKKL